MPFTQEKGDMINYKEAVELALEGIDKKALPLSPDSGLILGRSGRQFLVARRNNDVMEASQSTKQFEDAYTFMVVTGTQETEPAGGTRRERQIGFVTEGPTPTIYRVNGEVTHVWNAGAYTPGLGFDVFLPKESGGKWTHDLFQVDDKMIALARELTKRYRQ